MSKKRKGHSNEDIKETVKFLLNQGYSQIEISKLIGQSQSSVSKIKREQEIAKLAKEEGIREGEEKLIANVADKIADRIVKNREFQDDNIIDVQSVDNNRFAITNTSANVSEPPPDDDNKNQ